ncbi:MAG: hypothetical protein LQ347_006495 [Umbilicaria vellea]|nr:MAG: hypothetical protein LQ347_006495 [Umbilicaria vellea]
MVGLVVPPIDSRYANIMVSLIRAVCVYNITLAILPLVQSRDNLIDIPLTPSQRALLGLDPNATPPMTPGTQYITPPRYPRSSTPRSGTPGSRSSSVANSPLSRKDSPSFGKHGIDSPFNPSASPLWQKAVGGARDTGRRHSYGSPSLSGLSGSVKEMSVLGAPNTPSPLTGRGASVALNSRWLYERGKGSPGSRGLL